MRPMNLSRRRFLAAATLGTGLVASPFSARALAQAKDQALGRWSREQIQTPALLLDLDAFESNIRAISDHCQSHNCAARPHAKTHKCVEIARRQVAAGARGVAAATVPEAEAMSTAGIKGVLLTSPILEPAKIARMVKLARDGGEVMLAVGHPREVELLAEAAAAERARVD